jgi:hypothetical protein
MTQVSRLLDLLAIRDMTSLELTLAGCGVNVTGRISDARKAGHRIDVYRDERGDFRYRLVQKPVQAELGLAS